MACKDTKVGYEQDKQKPVTVVTASDLFSVNCVLWDRNTDGWSAQLVSRMAFSSSLLLAKQDALMMARKQVRDRSKKP